LAIGAVTAYLITGCGASQPSQQNLTAPTPAIPDWTNYTANVDQYQDYSWAINQGSSSAKGSGHLEGDGNFGSAPDGGLHSYSTSGMPAGIPYALAWASGAVGPSGHFGFSATMNTFEQSSGIPALMYTMKWTPALGVLMNSYFDSDLVDLNQPNAFFSSQPKNTIDATSMKQIYLDCNGSIEGQRGALIQWAGNGVVYPSAKISLTADGGYSINASSFPNDDPTAPPITMLQMVQNFGASNPDLDIEHELDNHALKVLVELPPQCGREGFEWSFKQGNVSGFLDCSIWQQKRKIVR